MKIPSEPIRVAIIDDHRPTLFNLVKLLGYDDQIEIVTYASSGKKFLLDLDQMNASKLPQVVLTDVDMPEMSGIDMVLIAKCKYHQMHFLMLTVHDDERVLFDAIKAGASGYLLKDEKVSVIVRHIISLVKEGGVPMSPSIALKTISLLKSTDLEKQHSSQSNAPHLSSRELEVLTHLVDGKNYNDIASTLFISRNTVKKHIKSIYHKLHVSSKAQAIKMSHYYGLV